MLRVMFMRFQSTLVDIIFKCASMNADDCDVGLSIRAPQGYGIVAGIDTHLVGVANIVDYLCWRFLFVANRSIRGGELRGIADMVLGM